MSMCLVGAPGIHPLAAPATLALYVLETPCFRPCLGFPCVYVPSTILKKLLGGGDGTLGLLCAGEALSCQARCQERSPIFVCLGTGSPVAQNSLTMWPRMTLYF